MADSLILIIIINITAMKYVLEIIASSHKFTLNPAHPEIAGFRIFYCQLRYRPGNVVDHETLRDLSRDAE